MSNVTHSFNTTGSHNVSVTITNTQTNQVFTSSVSVQTADAPTNGGSCSSVIPNVSLWIDYHNPSNTCGPSAVSSCGATEALAFTVREFNYSTSCAPHTYRWNFGDNSAVVNGRDAAHTYSASGTYTVTCTVNNGGSDIVLSQAVRVGDGGNPTVPDVKVDFTPVPVKQLPHTYQFAASVSGVTGPVTFVWDFGDGNTLTRSNSAPMTYTYAKSGKYNVTVKVYSSTGQLLNTKTVTINDGTSKQRVVRH
jgi:PKD repeat protein